MKTTMKFISAYCFAIAIFLLLSQCNSPAVPASTVAATLTDTVVVDSLKTSAVTDTQKTTSRASLTLIIKNLNTTKSPVYVSLYDSTNKFLSKTDHLKEYKFMSDGNEILTEQINDLDYGKFAIATYQDVNSDGKCNRNLVGLPKEPYGFSNNFKPTIRAPHFDECNFAYNADKHTLTIAMIK